MTFWRHHHAMLGAALLLSACSGSSSDGRTGLGLGGAPGGVKPTHANIDRTCDDATFPSDVWVQCEIANYAKLGEAPLEQLDLAFQSRVLEQAPINLQQWTQRALDDPSWLDPRSGNTGALPLCATWQSPLCMGDPFRHPQAHGPDGDHFYTQEADVIPVLFYDRECARLSGRVWAPKSAGVGAKPPTVLIINGSVQGTETVWWWAAQALVRAGYAAMTFDPRGQGRSDWQTPSAQQGGNLNLKVFWEGGVDAIDFFHSTPTRPYPHNQTCAGTYPTQVTAYNPIWNRIDPARLGVAGHSAGAIASSVIQGYDAPGAAPWPGQMDTGNPVSAVVAWDSLIADQDGSGGTPAYGSLYPPEIAALIVAAATQGNLPRFGIRAPAMSVNSDYTLIQPVPFPAPPDPDLHKAAIVQWQAAGIPMFGLTLAGTYHADQLTATGTPATSWCPDISTGACRGGWAIPSYTYYTVAWFDRWLKQPGEPGYADADARLVDDGGPQGAIKMSWHFRSARDFPDRSAKRQHCEDIRAGCD